MDREKEGEAVTIVSMVEELLKVHAERLDKRMTQTEQHMARLFFTWQAGAPLRQPPVRILSPGRGTTKDSKDAGVPKDADEDVPTPEPGEVRGAAGGAADEGDNP